MSSKFAEWSFLKCLLRPSILLNFFLQRLQGYLIDFSCTDSTWTIKVALLEKALLHLVHWWGLMPRWTSFTWHASFLSSVKANEHFSHGWSLIFRWTALMWPIQKQDWLRTFFSHCAKFFELWMWIKELDDQNLKAKLLNKGNIFRNLTCFND